MRLSVVIIGYNSWAYLEKSLASLCFLHSDPQAEIIYVDNASTDETLSRIRQFYPSIICIENRENTGVSIARNQGIRRSRGEYIWLLDSDTEITESSLNKMLAFMDTHSEAGLCGCKMYGQDGQVQASCRKFPSLNQKFRSALAIFAGKLPGRKKSFRQMDYNVDSAFPFEVDYVIGACQLIRKEALKEIGLLDEAIFYGPEDADFCLRMKQAGYKVYYLPQTFIYHAYQRISSHKIFSKITRKHFQGLVYYFWKHRCRS